MNTYEFQILRYRPDHVSEEFVNLGLVLFVPATGQLCSSFAKSIARTTDFFPQLDGRQLKRTLRHLEAMLRIEGKDSGNRLVFDNHESVEDITRRYMTPDDTALYFTSVQKGIDDEDISQVFDELFERLIERHAVGQQTSARSDTEVWSQIYRPVFHALGIARRLNKHTVVTENDQLEFSHAWKNEIWHCYEPITFDLKQADSIKNKVYRWVGRLDELRSAEEAVEVKLLASLPQDKELMAFILEKLDQKEFGQSKVTIVKPNDARKLAQQVKRELEAHDAEENDKLPY